MSRDSFSSKIMNRMEAMYDEDFFINNTWGIFSPKELPEYNNKFKYSWRLTKALGAILATVKYVYDYAAFWLYAAFSIFFDLFKFHLATKRGEIIHLSSWCKSGERTILSAAVVFMSVLWDQAVDALLLLPKIALSLWGFCMDKAFSMAELLVIIADNRAYKNIRDFRFFELLSVGAVYASLHASYYMYFLSAVAPLDMMVLGIASVLILQGLVMLKNIEDKGIKVSVYHFLGLRTNVSRAYWPQRLLLLCSVVALYTYPLNSIYGVLAIGTLALMPSPKMKRDAASPLIEMVTILFIVASWSVLPWYGSALFMASSPLIWNTCNDVFELGRKYVDAVIAQVTMPLLILSELVLFGVSLASSLVSHMYKALRSCFSDSHTITSDKGQALQSSRVKSDVKAHSPRSRRHMDNGRPVLRTAGGSESDSDSDDELDSAGDAKSVQDWGQFSFRRQNPPTLWQSSNMYTTAENSLRLHSVHAGTASSGNNSLGYMEVYSTSGVLDGPFKMKSDDGRDAESKGWINRLNSGSSDEDGSGVFDGLSMGQLASLGNSNSNSYRAVVQNGGDDASLLSRSARRALRGRGGSIYQISHGKRQDADALQLIGASWPVSESGNGHAGSDVLPEARPMSRHLFATALSDAEVRGEEFARALSNVGEQGAEDGVEGRENNYGSSDVLKRDQW